MNRIYPFMKEDIGEPREGLGIRVEFSISGVDIVDANGNSASINADHLDMLFKRWEAYKAGVAAFQEKVA